MELKDIVDIILRINAGADSFAAANLVEHPELIAERIGRLATLVGRENVITGADCGFAVSAVRFNDTHPSAARDPVGQLRGPMAPRT